MAILNYHNMLTFNNLILHNELGRQIIEIQIYYFLKGYH